MEPRGELDFNGLNGSLVAPVLKVLRKLATQRDNMAEKARQETRMKKKKSNNRQRYLQI
jgi:hypothetical protein